MIREFIRNVMNCEQCKKYGVVVFRIGNLKRLRSFRRRGRIGRPAALLILGVSTSLSGIANAQSESGIAPTPEASPAIRQQNSHAPNYLIQGNNNNVRQNSPTININLPGAGATAQSPKAITPHFWVDPAKIRPTEKALPFPYSGQVPMPAMRAFYTNSEKEEIEDGLRDLDKMLSRLNGDLEKVENPMGEGSLQTMGDSPDVFFYNPNPAIVASIISELKVIKGFLHSVTEEISNIPLFSDPIYPEFGPYILGTRDFSGFVSKTDYKIEHCSNLWSVVLLLASDPKTKDQAQDILSSFYTNNGRIRDRADSGTLVSEISSWSFGAQQRIQQLDQEVFLAASGQAATDDSPVIGLGSDPGPVTCASFVYKGHGKWSPNVSINVRNVKTVPQGTIISPGNDTAGVAIAESLSEQCPHPQ